MRDSDIDAVRRFNRFHTRLVGALNEHIVASKYSLPQCRVMYEIQNAPPDRPPVASELAEALAMDPGYLSRMLAGLESEGMIARTPSPENARRLSLTMTRHGSATFAVLDRTAADEVGALIDRLSAPERRDLVACLHRVRRLLGDAGDVPEAILRDPEPGDLGFVIHAQTRLYAEEYGWDWTFEAMLSEIVAQYVRTFDPTRERCWIAELEGRIVGSVFVVSEDETTAKLRMLYVDAAARGQGLGRRLVEECLAFARARGYRRMVLWTNDILVSARRIYQATGFELIEEEPHHSFGKDLVGQYWGRDL